ncbi:MAG: 5-formyltetrahydrofolate cyclo-ligase [Sulfurimonadaceae bacterium]|jgi:5-formyltetrahydrofolate cyclo-ligase|nr:5-formyltetrahydrofolate cyclo-ligase [Sulfurimonadaceae bacterium]
MALTKKNFRKICLEKMRNASMHNKHYKNNLINNYLLEELKNVTNKKILFFYPLKFEPNIRRALLKLRKRNQIFLPFMEGESFKVVPFRLPLTKKKFDIFEAGNTLRTIKKIDIAIVPAVGVDGNLQRVGFGKGMYDRFFAKLQQKPYTIFVQSEFCRTKEFICDHYDVKCDLLLTPKGRLENKGTKDVKRNTTR